MLAWNLGSGHHTILGCDHIKELSEHILIPDHFIETLHRRGIYFWHQVISTWTNDRPIWKEAAQINLSEAAVVEWKHIFSHLNLAGLYRNEPVDTITWSGNIKENNIVVADRYFQLCLLQTNHPGNRWFTKFWSPLLPIKITIFFWLVWKNKNLTWENLQVQNWSGPGFCVLCGNDAENNTHLFGTCSAVATLWQQLEHNIGSVGPYIRDIKPWLTWWSNQSSARRLIPAIFIWEIWKWRNNIIFNNHRELASSVLERIA